MRSSVYIDLFGRNVGQVSVDGTSVRGEGDLYNSQLVVPLEVELQDQPSTSAIGIGAIRAVLGTDSGVSLSSAICPPTYVDLVATCPPLQVLSREKGGIPHPVDLRFALSPLQIEELERRRHVGIESDFHLYLQIEPAIVGVRTSQPAHGRGEELLPEWSSGFGQFSEVVWFRASNPLQPLRVDVPQTTWVEKVLPPLGYDRFRLLELRLPPPLPNGARATAEFDKALQELSSRRYDSSLSTLRGLIAMWNRQFDPSTQRRLADVVAGQLGWEDDDPQRIFLDRLWKAATDLVNESHHPESAARVAETSPDMARLAFIVVAALSEYLGGISS